jgi:uncharacterized repeat protein (TIGR03987 family)
MLVPAIVFITLALVLYTVAVWWEKSMGILKGRHVLFFWLGFACDTTGTLLMESLAGGGFRLSFHAVTGALAILLMLFHAVWGTVVHASRMPGPKARFHKFSVVVWALWLLPYLSGVVVGMTTR